MSTNTELIARLEEQNEAQLAAAQGQSLPILQVSAFVEGFLDEVEEPPERNCRCHISPPCDDCVDHSCLRELFSDARRLVKTISELKAAPIPQQPSIPEGWKLVPIEPTEAMGVFVHRQAYKNAIAAAQQPKETK